MATYNEIWSGRVGDFNDQAVRNYTRVFQVRFTVAEIAAGPLSVVDIIGLPRAGDIYIGKNGETDIGAWCRSANAKQDGDDPRFWTVEYKYSSEASDSEDPATEASSGSSSSSGGTPRDPLLRAPTIRWGKMSYTRAEAKALGFRLDAEGVPIFDTVTPATSAGEPYDPPLEREVTVLTLTITINKAEFDPVEAAEYGDAVNETTFTILGDQWPLAAVRCMGITGDFRYEQGISYWMTTYEFAFRHVTGDGSNPLPGEGWWEWKLDAGHYAQKTYKWTFTTDEAADGGPSMVVTAENTVLRDVTDLSPVNGLVLLDGLGKALEIGEAPVFRQFMVYPLKDFNLLNIGL